MMKWTKQSAVVAAMIVTLPVASFTAFAGTTDSQQVTTISHDSFQSNYQAKQSTETGLWQTSQAYTGQMSTTMQALSTTVQNITTEVTAIYTVEGDLAANTSSIPQLSQDKATGELMKLENNRMNLLVKSNNLWKLVDKYVKSHGRDSQWAKKALRDHASINKQLAAVNKQIADLRSHDSFWKSHPYDFGLVMLRQSILRLQDSAIHYTNVLINLENQANGSSTVTSSTYGTGLTTSTDATVTANTLVNGN